MKTTSVTTGQCTRRLTHNTTYGRKYDERGVYSEGEEPTRPIIKTSVRRTFYERFPNWGADREK